MVLSSLTPHGVLLNEAVDAVLMFPHKIPQFKHFVGIDLGGGRGKNTAVAELYLKGRAGRVVMAGQRNGNEVPWYDDALTAYLENLPAETVVAVDGPLTLPACLRCSLSHCPGGMECGEPAVQWMNRAAGVQRERNRKPVVTPYTQRVTELYLHQRLGIQLREAMGQSLGPVTARAQHLARRWQGRWRRDINLIEVCPKATIAVLCGRRAADGYRKRAHIWEARATILEELSGHMDFKVWRESVLRNVHVFEAVISALTALLWATQGWTVPPGFAKLAETDGWVWVPRDRKAI